MNTDNVVADSNENVALKLIDEMSFWMSEQGVVDTQSWKQGVRPEVYTTADRHVERFWLNRHWVQLFTSLPMDEIIKTREARGCLMNGECPLSEYVRKFKTVVIPYAIRLGILKTA